MSHLRTVEWQDEEHEYRVSTSERLLEEICMAFGTELLPAVINPTPDAKLVRLSRPAVFSGQDGARMTIQFQLTRFSPLYGEWLTHAYKRSLRWLTEEEKEQVESGAIRQAVASEHQLRDPFLEVTQTDYFDKAHLFRWPKTVYGGIFDGDTRISRGKPFHIHDVSTFPPEALPLLYFTFHIHPWFYIHLTPEDISEIYDELWIRFPKITARHERSIQTSLKCHPINQLISPDRAFVETRPGWYSYKIHSKVPRQTTMGFILAYLRNFLFSRTLA